MKLKAIFDRGFSSFIAANSANQALFAGNSKESRPIVDPALVCGEGPGFGWPPGSGLCMTLHCSTYFWSVGEMEYWKNDNGRS